MCGCWDCLRSAGLTPSMSARPADDISPEPDVHRIKRSGPLFQGDPNNSIPYNSDVTGEDRIKLRRRFR